MLRCPAIGEVIEASNVCSKMCSNMQRCQPNLAQPGRAAVVDISRFDWCKVGDGVIYTSIKNELDAKNGGRPSNVHDALIAEVAIANGFTLVTADADLAEAARNHKGMVHHFAV